MYICIYVYVYIYKQQHKVSHQQYIMLPVHVPWLKYTRQGGDLGVEIIVCGYS